MQTDGDDLPQATSTANKVITQSSPDN